MRSLPCKLLYSVVLLSHRKFNDKPRAARLIGPHPNIAAMIFHDLIDDRQSEARTLLFGGKSRLENSNSGLRGHAATVVGNFEIRCAPRGVVRCRYLNLAPSADSANRVVQ